VANKEEIDVLDKLMTPGTKKLGKGFDMAGFTIRFVGGSVRDALLGETPKDLDFATDATPDEMRDIATINKFKYLPTGIAHGTVTLGVDGEMFEVTTLRVDVETDGRHAEVEFTRDFEKDAERRDLTINAMSMDFQGNVYDYFGGREDLKNKVVRFVGVDRLRVEEDYLRILRYFRFAARFNASMDVETLELFSEPAILDGLHGISVERFWQEMSKLLAMPDRVRILDAMYKSRVNRALSVFRFNPVETARAPDPVAALSTLVAREDLESFFKTWKLSKDEQAKIDVLVRNRLVPVSETTIENWMVRDKFERDWVAAIAEIQGEPTLAQYARDFQMPTFPVTGKDLIEAGMAPGKAMGDRLRTMERSWIYSRFQRTKEELMAMD
jgi:tRNA nucleotidyltransferase (CCA-adding enzyme)